MRRDPGALCRLAELLERRRLSGKVRHCHGDLHLRNICLVDGEPTLFDCLEFDPSLACIDVLYDLAFLLMDLEQRGAAPVSPILVFNRYLDRTSEADGIAAVPFFASLRAAMRAHVGARRDRSGSRMPRSAQAGIAEARAPISTLAGACCAPRRRASSRSAGSAAPENRRSPRRWRPELGGFPGARVCAATSSASGCSASRWRSAVPQRAMPKT